MQFKVISFGLMLSLLVLNGVKSECNNYYYYLEEGQTKYIFNDEYPNEYEGQQNCFVKIESPVVVKIKCTIEQNSVDCRANQFRIYIGNSTNVYCGSQTVVNEGFNPIIQLITTNNSKGRFLCEIKADINQNDCQCGWKKVTRIVGGRETGVNEYPPMAGIVNFVNRNLDCGATIISLRHVITAVHCIKNMNINEIGVVVGEHDTSTGADTSATRLFALLRYTIHPEYYEDNGYSHNDVAVCKINGRFEYNSEVGPACLPFQHRYDSFVGIYLTALGWGLTEYGGSKSNTLQEVDLQVISNRECQRTYPNVNDRNLCTFTQGKDTCQMDSGGPLFWLDPATNKLVLIGTTSSGIGCASSKPSISMRVGSFLDWIISVTPGEQYCIVE
ncbi:PREDICTED: venom serine protease-like isoform X2 [Cyphomyrmex costatus]|uniref:venom serine protease-like isoform X2 n=1 Tax=Cyphomyrmex costatus TaxID=456900 RepID=UPI00085241D4|nr:PREDICTED: venom serine protease-like isoform X2 [Cyphomyrmex costatus]